jgi:hypothetical protein
MARKHGVPVRAVLLNYTPVTNDDISQVRIEHLKGILKHDGRIDEVCVMDVSELGKMFRADVTKIMDGSTVVDRSFLNYSVDLLQLFSNAFTPDITANLGDSTSQVNYQRLVVPGTYESVYDGYREWIDGRESVAVQPFLGIKRTELSPEEYADLIDYWVGQGTAVVVAADWDFEVNVWKSKARPEDPTAKAELSEAATRHWTPLRDCIERNEGWVLGTLGSPYDALIAAGQACTWRVTETTRTVAMWAQNQHHLTILHEPGRDGPTGEVFGSVGWWQSTRRETGREMHLHTAIEGAYMGHLLPGEIERLGELITAPDRRNMPDVYGHGIYLAR